MPVNMSGGLISKGEPVGASHLGQIVEIVFAATRHSWVLGKCSMRKVGLAHVLGAGGNCAVTILAAVGGRPERQPKRIRSFWRTLGRLQRRWPEQMMSNLVESSRDGHGRDRDRSILWRSATRCSVEMRHELTGRS